MLMASTAVGTIRLNFHWWYSAVAEGCGPGGGGSGGAGSRRIRLALEFFGGLCRYLRDVQRDVLLLAAALDGNGDVIGSLDGVEDFLTALWVIQGVPLMAVTKSPAFKPQFAEYRRFRPG